jgi:hypothetical protein
MNEILNFFFFFLGELENGGNIRSKEQASSVFKGNKLGIIIPFKERFDELLEFVPHINSFLKKQDVLHEIFVINQVIKLSYLSMIVISLKIFFFIQHSG